MTIKSLFGKVAAHPGEAHLLYLLIAAGLIFYGGYYYGTRQCQGMSETERRQLKDELTEKEKKIVEADLAIGKVKTELKDQRDLNTQMKQLQQDQQDDVDRIKKRDGLLVQQIARLSAQLVTHRTDGEAGVTHAGGITECGACQGEVRFGKPPYATCTWADYAALKGGKGGGSIDLNMGVHIDHVALKQKPKDGALEAVIDRIWFTAPDGSKIGDAKLDESSRVFTAPNELGDQARRHLFGILSTDPNRARLLILTKKGFSPFMWGAGPNYSYKGGKIGPEIAVGWQFR